MWCAPLWWRTLIWERVTFTTVFEAITRSMVLTVHCAGCGGPYRGLPWDLPPCRCGCREWRCVGKRLKTAGASRCGCLVEYPVWACVARWLHGLECDRGQLADLQGVDVGHAAREEQNVSGVGCLHVVPYGVFIMGPCRTDCSGVYGGEPTPVCRPCLGDGACRRLDGDRGVY